MSDNITNPSADANSDKKTDTLIDLRPTLFIGVGGTGMEVLLRMRRRILNTLWGGAGSKVRIDSLTEFPVAQFIQFDLDSGAVIDSGRAQSEDLQFDAIKFTDDEKIVESFDMDKYSRDDEALEKYPHVKEWLSLTPKKIRELGIDPNKGAGQIRAISRLYFFDKYTKIRDKIRLKLITLKAGLSHEQQLSKLGLKMETSKFRIVVVGSIAGGTGSGSFLDMGWLARWLAETEVNQADVELMLFMPTGYAGANKDRTEANGYAALMELEAAMRGNKGYVGRWDTYDRPVLSSTPYSEIYLIDSGNVAQQHTKNIQDVYHMLADTLFEDFASGDFAKRKRSVAVNQAQHKNFLFDALVPKNRFGDMRLSYSKRYSGLGQSVLDTRQEARRDQKAYLWAGEMLKAFFGVGSGSLGANRATDKQRDDFLADYVGLKTIPFNELPQFSDKSIELKRSSGEFLDYLLVNELLSDKNGSLTAGVEKRVNDRIDSIRTGFDLKEWATQVRLAVKEMERDAVRDQDSTADTTEDRVSKRRHELLDTRKKAIKDQLYTYLDNKEFGGLEYVLSLVEQMKDKIEAQGNGLIANLQVNAERYKEIKEAVRTREFERLVNNLEQTKGLSLFGTNEKQATSIMDHLRTEIANGIKFHLRAKAADEAAIFLNELSTWLGKKIGVDNNGIATWNGLVGEFQAGREAVFDMLKSLERSSAILQADLKKEHATLIYIATPEHQIPTPNATQMRDWADDAFKDFGGSKQIFEMLAESEKKGQILSKVRKMAERQLLAVAQVGDDTTVIDPLIVALEQMSVATRAELFRKWIACAMPWVDANLAGDFALKADQYKCFIGVSNDAEFKRKFGEELSACMPTMAGISSAQLAIVTMGVSGRAVCYTELSGLPLTVLRGIDSWRTSYRKESEKSPVHTHIDSTQFSHPIAPTTDEIGRLAEDFKFFLMAVMTNILSRSTVKVIPAGQYQFAVARGDTRRIGNERAMRQNGLPLAYREAIINRVKDLLDDADAHCLAVLSALASYYESQVYTPKLVADATGNEDIRKGFASAISGEASAELRDRAKRKGLLDREIDQISNKLLEPNKLKLWSKAIPDSDADAYEWEVREPGEDGLPRLKFVVNQELLEPGQLMPIVQSILGSAVQNNVMGGATGQSQFQSMPGMPPPLTPPPLNPAGMPPPLVAHQYHVGINGQQYGPYNAQQLVQMVQAGQVSPSSKVWRQGLEGWVDLNTLPELANLLTPATAMPPPLMPPPLV